jgi:predicted molibdopterin-dependent oxidoreductase YjgC
LITGRSLYQFNAGTMTGPLRSSRAAISINETVDPGQLFATFQTPRIFLNTLTCPHRDGPVGTPEYK